MDFRMANPKFLTLSAADTESVVTLDSNYGQVEVTLVANPATTYFNSSDTPIGTVAGDMDGNHVLNAILISKVVADLTSGPSKIRVRSAGTPTVQVMGL